MRLRSALYQFGILRQHKLTVPVISVGNLVLGGSGKTPIVHCLAKMLQEKGYHPAIISRGYKGKARKPVNIVSDGKTIQLEPEEAGDEPYMLAKLLPGVVVITGKERINPAQTAINEFAADVVILDDGFQHLAVNRDLDIVLFDSTVLAGNSRIFPAGVLREPVKALVRTDVFLLTGQSSGNRDRSDKFKTLLQTRWPNTPVFIAQLNSWKLMNADGRTTLLDPADAFFAFCGIANPERFQDSLEVLHMNVKGFQSYSDHKAYSQHFVDKLEKTAKRCGATKLVTTRKDFVKLEHLQWTLPLCVLQVEQHVPQQFNDYVIEKISA